MASAAQLAKSMQKQHLDLIDDQLERIGALLAKYDALIEQRNRLTAARRALLSERSPTAGGGRGLTQEEVVKAMSDEEYLTVDAIAKKLSATPGAVRAHLNRGNEERFTSTRENGVVMWALRDPETDEEEEDDD